MNEEIRLKTPRKEKTAKVKAGIVSATTRLLREKGMDYVTVTNICKVAGVSVGSFYHHFSNKDEVLSYYLSEAFRKNDLEFDRIRGNDIVENIIRCYELYNQFLVDQGLEFVVNYYTTSNKGLYSRTKSINNSAIVAPIMQKIKDLCTHATENGFMRSDCDTDLFLFDLTVIEKGVIFDWCVCEGSYNLVYEVSRIMDNYMRRTIVTDKYVSEFDRKGEKS